MRFAKKRFIKMLLVPERENASLMTREAAFEAVENDDDLKTNKKLNIEKVIFLKEES